MYTAYCLFSTVNLYLALSVPPVIFMFTRAMSEKFSILSFPAQYKFGNLPTQRLLQSLINQICPQSPLYLFSLDDIDSGFDVGESMHCGQDGVPLVLLTKFSSGTPVHSKRRGVHEPADVEVLLKVGNSVLHLILIKIGLHKSDLYVCLRKEGRTKEGRRNGAFEVSHSTHWLVMVWKSAELEILQGSFSYPALTELASRRAHLSPGDQNQGRDQRVEL